MLVNGKWTTDWQPVQAKDSDGRFIRQVSKFRTWITPDGGPGPEGQASLKAEAGRFELIVAYICPWASRTLMARVLKGLEDVISISVVTPQLTEQGWAFGDFPGTTGPDHHIGAQYLHSFYTHSDPEFSGRATVPVLWDKQEKQIVNNESADILRILNDGFGDLADTSVNLRPDSLLSEIDALNDALYEPFNNGVYKAGFASSQLAYEEALATVFDTLWSLEALLAESGAYLLGDELTESDIRAFVTLIRFDAAYYGLFKTNLARIVDFPHLQAYLKRILQLPGIRTTVRIDHIKAGYYSIKSMNPSGIIPSGPDLSELGL